MWVKIKRFENSKYNNKSKIVIFEIDGEEKFAILTRKVLDYIKPKNSQERVKLKVGRQIFVIYSHTKDKKYKGYLIKNVK